MQHKMTKEEVVAWRDRWLVVNEFEKEELRRRPPIEKLRQLANLMASVSAFGWDKQLAEDKAFARQRWLELYNACKKEQ